jgi:hypothetical protein
MSFACSTCVHCRARAIRWPADNFLYDTVSAYSQSGLALRTRDRRVLATLLADFDAKCDIPRPEATQTDRNSVLEGRHLL